MRRILSQDHDLLFGELCNHIGAEGIPIQRMRLVIGVHLKKRRLYRIEALVLRRPKHPTLSIVHVLNSAVLLLQPPTETSLGVFIVASYCVVAAELTARSAKYYRLSPLIGELTYQAATQPQPHDSHISLPTDA